MPNVETLLTAFTFLFSIGVPIYIYLRDKMVQSSNIKKVKHTTARVLKITFIILFLSIAVSSLFFFLLAAIFLRDKVITPTTLLFAAVFVTLLLSAFYGSGIYLTSIILENFTLPELRIMKQFKTQFIATHIFHGPISHLLIYTCMYYALYMLALIDLEHAKNYQLTLPPLLLLIMGTLMGMLFGISQIYNGTAPYQLIATFVSFVTYFYVTNSAFQNRLGSAPLGLYFTGTVVSAFVTLLAHTVYKTAVQKDGIDWDASGY